MITGIPNANLTIGNRVLTDTIQKVTGILGQLNANIKETAYTIKQFDPPTDKPTHSAKITLNSVDMRKAVVSEAKKLKNIPGLDRVYVKNDETKLARSENYRLRDKARDLRLRYPGASININKGILKQDDVEVDKFDLSNQIFC